MFLGRLSDLAARLFAGPWLQRKSRGGVQARRGPVTHVVVLDGTMSTLEEGTESNVGLIYKLLAEHSGHDLSLYYEAGIQWTSWSRTHEVLMGRGLNRQIRRAYGYLASRYRPGDRIFFFGYSRGAYAVRSLAGLIDRVGLLKAEAATERNVRQAYRLYQDIPDAEAARRFATAHSHPETRVEMIGAFDTVKSLGLRLPLLSQITDAQHAFHNHALSDCVRAGFHALALEETRQVYAPVMWESTEGWQGRLEQVWFPGSHGDVGGFLGGDLAARGLSNIPLVWMLTQAEVRGLPLPQGWRDRFPRDPEAPSIGMWQGWSKLFLLRARREVGRDPSERLHESAVTRGLHVTLPVYG
ncbi:DUF2235 domain-containing protein [Pseudooceanicola aestuarii]|uniref:DUF2235 domain-containing protein n=1 Tax=Pseudooceanicola aestuarii TaxID=2697319 RepID=UPI0013D26BFD|nr:DUF2235 domain-containing protein [Pseudooceanicola aestuarii]